MAEMYGCVINVTKELADKWLQTNNRNRTLKKYKLLRLEEAMETGTFELTHQGIAIDENGVLIDGHHRLTCISKTGIPTKMFVVFNAPNSRFIDTGASRTDRDAMYMSGAIEKDSTEYQRYVYSLCGVIIYLSNSERVYKLADAGMKHMTYLKFKESIDKAISIIKRQKKGKGASASIAYAMVSALEDGVPEEIIDKWHWIVTTGDFFVPDDMQATQCGRQVLLFKNYTDQMTRGASRNDYIEVIKKAESSIYYFAKRQPVAKVCGRLFFPELKITESEMRGY